MSPVVTRDVNELLATSISGAFTGSIAGIFYSSRGIIPGTLACSTIAFIGQTTVNELRNWRILESIKILESHQKTESTSKAPWHWKKNMFKERSNQVIPERDEIDFDPVQHVLEYIGFKIAGLFYSSPPSYITRAADLEYRKTLNYKLHLLNQQVDDLQKELLERNINTEY